MENPRGMRKALSADELTEALTSLPRWSGDAKGITAEWKFGTYGEAVGFAMQVALAAERLDHHPDITLSWGRVAVFFVTHDAGGVTAADIAAARAVQAIQVG